MSWDLFVMDLPKGLMKVQDIPADFERLGLRALDSQTEGGVFVPETAATSFRAWRAYRDDARRATAAAQTVHDKLRSEQVSLSTRCDIELQEAKRRHVEEVPLLETWAKAGLEAAPGKHRHHFF